MRAGPRALSIKAGARSRDSAPLDFTGALARTGGLTESSSKIIQYKAEPVTQSAEARLPEHRTSALVSRRGSKLDPAARGRARAARRGRRGGGRGRRGAATRTLLLFSCRKYALASCTRHSELRLAHYPTGSVPHLP
eukprot:scaffold6519_cov63-Phaeocystis_antarctica.AAC.1